MYSKEPLRRATALWFCSGISILYVAALYVIVPNSIQRLSRDDPRQIRWRSLATVIVGVVSLIFSRLVSSKDGIISISGLSFATFVYEVRVTMIALGHVMVLYLSPLVHSLIRINRMSNLHDLPLTRLKVLLKNYYILCIEPTVATAFRVNGNEQLQWILRRNYIIAPLTEEIVFRCSIIPILEVSGMGDSLIIWVSPLFFGIAHLHHAFLKYCQGLPLLAVLLQTIFQFAYTTLFGIYTSYVFIRTKSVFAVFVCHAFCNIMGLPDLSFLNQGSPYYSARLLLGAALGVGVFGFYLGFIYEVFPKAMHASTNQQK